MAELDELITRWRQVRDETQPEANTATRVGQLGEDTVVALQEALASAAGAAKNWPAGPETYGTSWLYNGSLWLWVGQDQGDAQVPPTEDNADWLRVGPTAPYTDPQAVAAVQASGITGLCAVLGANGGTVWRGTDPQQALYWANPGDTVLLSGRLASLSVTKNVNIIGLGAWVDGEASIGNFPQYGAALNVRVSGLEFRGRLVVIRQGAAGHDITFHRCTGRNNFYLNLYGFGVDSPGADLVRVQHCHFTTTRTDQPLVLFQQLTNYRQAQNLEVDSSVLSGPREVFGGGANETATITLRGYTDLRPGSGYAVNTSTISDSRYTDLRPTGAGGGTSYTDEQAQDAAAALLVGGTHTGISFTYDDANNRLNATVTGGGGTTPTLPAAPANVTQDDVLDELEADVVAGKTSILNYELQLPGSSYAPLPVGSAIVAGRVRALVGNIAAAPGDISLRVKADAATSAPAGLAAQNEAVFTADLLRSQFTIYAKSYLRGNTAAAWKDSSGNGKNLTQPDAAKQYPLVSNSTVRGTSTVYRREAEEGQVWLLPTLSDTPSDYVFILAVRHATGGQTYLLESRGGAVVTLGINVGFAFFQGGPRGDLSMAAGETAILTIVLSEASAYVRKNGITLAAGLPYTKTVFMQGGLLGNSGGGNVALKGDLLAFLVKAGDMPLADIQTVERNIAAEIGITI